MFRLLLCLENSEVREHFRILLDSESVRAMLPDATLFETSVLDRVETERKVVEELRAYFSADRRNAAILVSDLLALPGLYSECTKFAKKCQAEFEAALLGKIAAMRCPQRVSDIDRSICLRPSPEEFIYTVNLVKDRLGYLAMPEIPAECGKYEIVVQEINSGNMTEVLDYFRFRHQIYSIMGYLDPEVEGCRSKLDVSEADTHAVHVAAFCNMSAGRKVIGTARVVTNINTDRRLQNTLEQLVRSDPVVKKRLNTPYPLGLPIFQSFSKMNSIIHEIFVGNQICGELSRVIVSRELRGIGLSRRLIEEALRRSGCRGANRFFLECLPIHETLYQEHGFRRIPGVQGEVVDVARTMIAMEMSAEQKRAASANLG